MEFLTPDAKYTTDNGIEVCRKFLPENQRPNRLLNTTGNNPEYVTIHNTEDINEAAGTNDAEQYARATFNGNMNGVTVHFYVDEAGCWQILPMNEVGYHAADGYNGTGNTKSVAIEIIMDGSGKDYDAKAEERGAKLAAWLLYKYGLGIDRLKTHNDWYPKKYCPAYILPHWVTFKATVEKQLNALKDAEKQTDEPDAPAGDGAANGGVLYRVQVGAYRVKANAEAMLKKLKAAGYDAILKEEKTDAEK